MRIINDDEVKCMCSCSDDFLQLNLTKGSLNKVALQIMYYFEHGYKKFVLNCDLEVIGLSVKVLIDKLRLDYLFKLVCEFDVCVAFTGFPRCVFENEILKPNLRWQFEDKILFFERTDRDGMVVFDKAKRCLNSKNCKGIPIKYLSCFKDDSFEPMVSNNMLYDLNLAELEKFKSLELKEFGERVLDDFRMCKFCNRKKFVFVKSYPKGLVDGSRERFVYYIHNRKDDFDVSYDFLKEFFDENFLGSVKKYLILSSKLVLSFAVMGDGKLRKTFYFNVDGLSCEDIDELSSLTGIDIKPQNVWGVGVDFKDDEIFYRVYYKAEKVTVKNIKDFVSDVSIDNKKSVLKFSNSLTKAVKGVCFNYKYLDNDVYSKRIDISLESNKFRLNQLHLLFNINLSHFSDKELYQLSFEISNEKPERVEFYYVLKLPEEEREF